MTAAPGGSVTEAPQLSASGKMFAVLDAFSHTRQALTLSELARTCRLPLSTVHRLVRDLVEWGGLERDASGRYRVGLRLWELGTLAPRGPGLREVALPVMRDLSALTRENVRLAVRQGVEATVIEQLSSRLPERPYDGRGVRLPLPATGAGLVLLADSPAEVREQILNAPLRRFTPYTVTSGPLLRRMLAAVRQNGFAVCDRQWSSDAVSVAAPIRSVGGGTVASLSIVAYGGGADVVRTLVPQVRTAARAVSLALESARAEV